jgi:hypothetical protein
VALGVCTEWLKIGPKKDLAGEKLSKKGLSGGKMARNGQKMARYGRKVSTALSGCTFK